MTTTTGRRIAVVGLFDSPERDKLALILHGIRRAGHIPILVDAELFATGAGRLDRGPAVTVRGEVDAVLVDGIRGRHRTLGGAGAEVSVDAVTVLTPDPRVLRVGEPKPGTARPVRDAVRVDAVWPETLDITRRLEFEGLYRDLAEGEVPSLAGSWESLLNGTFKHRTRRILARSPIPQPRHVIVTADLTDDEIERLRRRQVPTDVWVKAPDDTHSHGVFWMPRDRDVAPVARQALRSTPDGELCLLEEDICGIVTHADGRPYRADVAVTVLDGQVIHATMRAQPVQSRPTNSLHGGRAAAIDPRDLPTAVRRIAVDALAATGNRYGSVDIFGGGGRPPVAGEVNIMPGGRSPGFLTRVVDPLVAAYAAEIERTRQ